MVDLISRVDQSLKENNPLIFVFDIDSTIFNVSPRNQAILEDLLKIGSFRPLISKQTFEKAKAINLTWKDWGLEPLYNEISQLPENVRIYAKEFWKKHFFAGHYLPYDEPYAGVLSFMHQLHRLGFKVKYLTGRDDKRMRASTLAQLKYWKLPLESDKDLITKPHKGMADGPYKQSELLKIYKEHQQTMIFIDNEPSVLKHCFFDENKCLPYFFVSVHSSRYEPQNDWPTLSPENYLSYSRRLSCL